MKLHIKYIVSTSGTLMAATFVGSDYYVEHGETFEEAEKELIAAIGKKLTTVVPEPKEIEITL